MAEHPLTLSLSRVQSLSLCLADIPDSLADCRAGLVFLGDLCKKCPGLALTEVTARGLGHILHGLTADIEGTESGFKALEQFFTGRQEEHAIDLDQMDGHGPAKGEEVHHA